jgi:hypothetical protein
MGRYSAKEDMLIAEDIYQFPVETCSMVKCVVAQWHKRIGSTTIKRILGNSSACEPFNLSWEIMKKRGYDVYNNEVIYRGPTVEGARLERLVKFTMGQILDVAEWLTGQRRVVNRSTPSGRRKVKGGDCSEKPSFGQIKAGFRVKENPSFLHENLGHHLDLKRGAQQLFR